MPQHNTFDTLDSLKLSNGKTGRFYSLPKLGKAGVGNVSRDAPLGSGRLGQPVGRIYQKPIWLPAFWRRRHRDRTLPVTRRIDLLGK